MPLGSTAPRFPAKPLGLRRPAHLCLLALAGFLPLMAGCGGGGDHRSGWRRRGVAWERGRPVRRRATGPRSRGRRAIIIRGLGEQVP